MTDRLDLLVTDWLRTEAPSQASPDILEDALSRVATAGQERYVTQWLLGDTIGRRRGVRLALAGALLAVALAGSAVLVGALLSNRPLPSGPLSNGPVVFRANGEAGPDFKQPVVDRRGGDADMYAVDDAGRIRRIIGDGTDHLLQSCPTVSPDGSHLAYQELDTTSISPTQAPVPEGQLPGPGEPYNGPLRYGFAIVALDAAGAPTDDPVRIVPAGPPDSIIDCPRWAPDGTKVAYIVDAGGEDLQLWVSTLDGQSTQLSQAPYAPNVVGAFDWADDSTKLTVAGDSDVWFVPADGGPAWRLLDTGAEAVDASPDGSRVAIATQTSLVILGPVGGELLRRVTDAPGDPVVMWSPDGTSVAVSRGSSLTVYSADGTRVTEIPVDVEAAFETTAAADFTPSFVLVAWSPDSRQLLLAAAAEFDTNGLISVAATGTETPVVVAQPTFALGGIRPGQVTWLGVHR